MQAKVYCRPVAKDVHEFYLVIDGERFYLFEQKFYMSNHRYFKKGVAVDDLGNFAKANKICIRNTLEKLPKYLKKVSRRYDVEIPMKSKSKSHRKISCKYEWLDLDETA